MENSIKTSLKNVADLMCEIDNRELVVIYKDLLDLEGLMGQQVFEYKDTIEMLLSLIEHGYNENNCYEQDIVFNAKRLIKGIK
jgi:hypothetical protein